MKTKKILVIMITLIFTLSILPVNAEEESTFYCSLELAQQMAIENNTSYKLQDGYINDAIDTYNDTVDANEKSAGKAASSFLAYFNKQIEPEVNEYKASYNIAANTMAKKDIKRISDYNVKISFINIKKAKFELENAKNNTAMKLKDLELGKVRFANGFTTKLEINNLEKAYKSSLAAQDTAQRQLNSELQTLNKYLGRSLTAYNIEPIMDLQPVDLSAIDLEQIKVDNIENRSDLDQLRNNVKIAKRKYDLTKDRYDEYVERLKVQNSREDMQEAMDDATTAYEDAQSKLEDKLNDLELSLSTLYDNMKTYTAALEDIDMEVANLQETLAIDKIKYDLGQISNYELQRKQLSLKNLEITRLKTVADMNKLYANLMLYNREEAVTKN